MYCFHLHRKSIEVQRTLQSDHRLYTVLYNKKAAFASSEIVRPTDHQSYPTLERKKKKSLVGRFWIFETCLI